MTKPFHSRYNQTSIKLAITAGFFWAIALTVAIITFANRGYFASQQQFFSAPTCASGVLHSSTCISYVQGSVEQASVSQQCSGTYGGDCTPYLNAVFLLPGNITVSTTIDVQFAGPIAWSAGTPATVQLWDNSVTAVEVNGQTLQTTSYPQGTSGEQSMYGLAILFLILGGLTMLYAVIRWLVKRPTRLPDIPDITNTPGSQPPAL